MPAPPASCRPLRGRGFTLIEVMVVMVIIAILITAVSLSLKGDRAGERLHEEAKRLTALLNLAREEAVMRDADLGLVLAGDAYLFVLRGDAAPEDETRQEGEDAAPAFMPLRDDTVFHERVLPEGVELRFERATEGEAAATGAALSSLEPSVLASANDMLLPRGVLSLRHPATTRVERILIDMDGARLEPADAGERP